MFQILPRAILAGVIIGALLTAPDTYRKPAPTATATQQIPDAYVLSASNQLGFPIASRYVAPRPELPLAPTGGTFHPSPLPPRASELEMDLISRLDRIGTNAGTSVLPTPVAPIEPPADPTEAAAG